MKIPLDKQSRMIRAKELGFTTIAYHGTNQKFNEFELGKGKPHILSGYAPHFSNSNNESKGYGGKVLKCLLRINNPFKASYTINLSKSKFKSIVGRLPKDNDRMTTMDVLRELCNIHGYERDRYEDKRKMWTLIYARLIELGYDSIIFPDILYQIIQQNYMIKSLY